MNKDHIKHVETTNVRLMSEHGALKERHSKLQTKASKLQTKAERQRRTIEALGKKVADVTAKHAAEQGLRVTMFQQLHYQQAVKESGLDLETVDADNQKTVESLKEQAARVESGKPYYFFTSVSCTSVEVVIDILLLNSHMKIKVIGIGIVYG